VSSKKSFLRPLAGLTLAAVLAALIFGAFVPAAEAHERRQVGPYTFVVGFLVEPAFVEQPNGVDLRVTRDGQPVNDVHQTLKVEVTTGGDSRTFDLATVFNQPGAYAARFIPTRTGTYFFRFFGTIEGTEVNERFESGPGRFNDIQSTTDLQFPTKVPTNAELAADIRQVEGNETAGNATTSPDVQQALDRADRAQTIGLVVGSAGILVGLIGVGLALRAGSNRRSGPRQPDGAEPV
jgi:hypothetical protein